MTDEGGRTRRVRALVSGRVQGVGFRWFARRVADELALTGWVRNLPDGRVEAEAAGPPADVEAFLERLRRGPRGARVNELAVSDLDGSTEGRGFEIRM